jgi:FkbM family methyltransferase
MVFTNTFSFFHHHSLSKKNILAAYIRFFKWQIKSTLLKGPFKHKFVNDAYLLVKKGMTGATGNVYVGLHEFNDMGFLLHYLQPNDCFVDVGANIGSYTILAAAAKKNQTISIEPDRNNFNWIQKNVTLNNCNHLVTIHNVALGKSKDTLKFSKQFDTVNHIVAENENSEFIEVEVDTLDNILYNTNPSIIKIDVEGYETNVLKGALSTLDKKSLQAIIIELNGSGNRYGFDENLIHNLLLSKNFLPYTYNPYSRELIESKIFGTHNTIYLRDIEEVRNRVLNAKPFSVLNQTI